DAGTGADEALQAQATPIKALAAPYISLQRWVLSAYLDEICRHANQRLEQMTAGRYQLQLSDEGGRSGRNAGLGLRVADRARRWAVSSTEAVMDFVVSQWQGLRAGQAPAPGSCCGAIV
ncbi:MAG: hypothetical protein ACODUE_13775, partial [Synechococcus sp.]